MASEVRVNTITNRSGLSTVTFGAYGIEFVGITTVEQLNVSSAVTNINATGVSTFAGNIDLNADLDVDGHTELDNVNIAGVLTATSANFSGNVTVLGTLTYEDVVNVDSVGIATARSGLRVTGGGLDVTGVSTFTGDIISGSSGFFYDYSTGRLGVGIDPPGSARLHVKGHSSLNNSLLVDVNTGDSTLGFAENGTEKWRIENVTSADALRFYDVTNTAERLRINSSGNIGIGTDNPTSKLHVNGGVLVKGPATPNINFSPLSGGSGNADISFDGNDLRIVSNSSTADVRINAYSRDNDFVLKQNGNIGIGTDNPAAMVEIKKTDNNAQLRVTSGFEAALWLVNGGGSEVNVINSGGSGKLSFRVGNTEKILFDEAGRILIGRSTQLASSNERLTVDNAMTMLRNNSTTTAPLYLRNDDSTASTRHPYLTLSDSSGNRGGIGIQNDDSSLWISGQTGIRFRGGTSSPGNTEWMRIGSSGQLGFGGANYGSSGQVLTSQGSSAAPQWATPAGALFDAVAILSDVKGDNVNGGQFNSGAWRVRDLNTEVDPSGIVTLSSNSFLLGAGTYVIRWSAPVYNVDKNNTKLRDTTSGVNVGYGNAAHAWSAGNTTTRSEGVARYTITSNKWFQIQHYCATTKTDGFGHAGYESSVFTVVEIYREA